MPLLESNDTHLHYEVHGHGPALVLIHAISTGAGMWRAQIERFARDHRVIVFDARGVGRSGPIRGWLRIRDRMAEDVANLLDHLGEQQADICGVSFGGVIAQHFVAAHPSRTRRLVIVDSYSDTRPTSLGKMLWLMSVDAVSELRPWSGLKTRLAINLVNYPPALNDADHPILAVVGEDSCPRSITFTDELTFLDDPGGAAACRGDMCTEGTP